jgi:POT family proton-dependent oligopeptide transporter
MTSPPNLTGMPPAFLHHRQRSAERFSYYGMKSVLTVFMARYILNQSGVLAPMNDNESYMYTHLFVFGVYFLPGSRRNSCRRLSRQSIGRSFLCLLFTAWAI